MTFKEFIVIIFVSHTSLETRNFWHKLWSAPRHVLTLSKLTSKERITPVLIDLHWLPVKPRIVFKTCVLTYTALSTGKPAYLRNKLSKFTTELGVSIRNSHDPHRLNEPRMNKEIGTRSFKYSAPRLFNSLPRSVKDSGNLKVFKKRLKTFLFSECYDLDMKTITDRYCI